MKSRIQVYTNNNQLFCGDDVPDNRHPYLKTLWICLALVAAATALIVLIFNTEPTAERESATRRTPMPVEVLTVSVGDYRPTITAMGTVKPAQEVTVRARVTGEVTSLDEKFVPGGRISRNDILLQLDPADYQTALTQAESELAAAQAALDIEMGEQAVARREYQNLRQNLSGMQSALVLREPQLQSAQARLEAAKAAVTNARLNIQRTTIRAPFNAMILTRDTDLGAQISVGDPLAYLVGTDRYWVEVPLSLSHLRWLERETADTALKVSIRDRNAWPADMFRSGRLHSVVDALDEQSRMVRLLVEVANPLPLDSTQPSLVLGSFVECKIPARRLTSVVRLPRQYIRKNGSVWLMKDGMLSIRRVNVLFQDETYVYINDGLNNGDAVVTTQLSNVRDGAALKLQERSSNEP